MIFARHQHLRLVAMILAIYAIVLQALFGALAQGNAVGAQLLAAELGVLCGPSGHHTGGGNDDRRDHDGSCCLNACRTVGVGPAITPVVAVLTVPARVEIVAIRLPQGSILASPSLRVPPARGPPIVG